MIIHNTEIYLVFKVDKKKCLSSISATCTFTYSWSDVDHIEERNEHGTAVMSNYWQLAYVLTLALLL